MTPATTGLTDQGLIVSVCHNAPAPADTYTDTLGRKWKQPPVCDACERPCHTKIEPKWPAIYFKSPPEEVNT